ncbi:chromate transporter [bacterium]|nr:chromate transporter [bacterium]
MMTLFYLIIEFFKIGIFSVGGGYATIPFLYHLINNYGWYTAEQLTNMIAISMITPGPVGANMATFAGFQTYGILGGVIATIALVFPSFLFVVAISKLLKTFRENFWVKSVLYSLKPAGCGLLAAVGIVFFKDHITNLPAFILFLMLFALSFFFKKNPLYYFLIAAIVGVLLQICGVKVI